MGWILCSCDYVVYHYVYSRVNMLNSCSSGTSFIEVCLAPLRYTFEFV